MSLDAFIQHFEDSIDDIQTGSLSGDSRFKELPSWDSLATLTVTDMLDIEYGVRFTGSDLREVDTLAELYEKVCAKQ